MRVNNSAASRAIAISFLFATSLAAEDPVRRPVALEYVPDSTTKLEQLIGDFDKHLQRPTRNQTWSRCQVLGTDLGASFEHRGELIFLFGDTIGPGSGDCIAHSNTTDPERGLELEFYLEADRRFLKVQPPGIRMSGFEVPTGGISLGDKAYLFCTTDHSQQHVMGRSVLVHFDPAHKRFQVVRDISKRPGNFINITARLAPPDTEHLPGDPHAPHVLLWGSGEYRRSHAYLACVDAREIEASDAMRYFCGLDAQSLPQWTPDESSAAPVVQHPVIGELSVCWCRAAGIWLMTYNSVRPRGIMLRWARQPWGPWSEGIVIFNPWRDGGYGQFMRAAMPVFGGGPWGPVIGSRDDPRQIWGGEYGPYLIERFTRVANDRMTIYYVMSTWNPYTVVLMRSQLDIRYEPNSQR